MLSLFVAGQGKLTDDPSSSTITGGSFPKDHEMPCRAKTSEGGSSARVPAVPPCAGTNRIKQKGQRRPQPYGEGGNEIL